MPEPPFEIPSALKHQSISEPFIDLLGKKYGDQFALVLTDVDSEKFLMSSGAKQGDLLSSLLFGSVFQVAMRKRIPCPGGGQELESSWETTRNPASQP